MCGKGQNQGSSYKQREGVHFLEETNANKVPHSALAGVSCHKPYLKCFYTDVQMRSKQVELETLAPSQRFETIGISKTWSCG